LYFTKKNILKNTFLLFALVVAFVFNINIDVNAQKEKTTLPKYFLVNFSYSYQNPGGDMDDRFGTNSAAGIGLDYLTSKNFIFGVQGDFLFGRNVEEDVLWNLRNSDGQLIGNNRAISNIQLTQRGFHANAFLGKLIPFKKSNPRVGIRITAGVGFLQHKIRVQQDPQSFVPQLAGAYAKGYDRLTNGFATSQFVGIQKVSENRRLNFVIGLDLVQGFTANQRSFDFDLKAADTEKYLDIIIGGKIAYTLPFEIGGNPDEIFY